MPESSRSFKTSFGLRYNLRTITAAQIRAARGLLKWTQGALATKSGLSVVTLKMMESETVQPRQGSPGAIRQAREGGGVEFTGTCGEGLGVEFRTTAGNPRTYCSRLLVFRLSNYRPVSRIGYRQLRGATLA